MFFLKRCGTVGAFFRCEELCSDYVQLSLLAFLNLFIFLQFLVELPDRDTTKSTGLFFNERLCPQIKENLVESCQQDIGL